jgi:alkanesulfonate monooxygenase SsuD/methylene tetrahydromethanopterin reductase-like flavin-dependent oxidoreductase (luciferase family)
MLIGHFTEEPYQPRDLEEFRRLGGTNDLGISNAAYDPQIGADLYNRYLDEKLYAEEVGFDALAFNEHHSLPGCLQGVTNVGLAIMARQTKRVKLIPIGNMIPVWDDPLWMAEQLAMIDMISQGRLVSGWVRGGGRESVVHNTPPVHNRERWDEAHNFIMKTWTTPGPFRWEGKHYHYRYVNPWALPLQKPHPQIWIPNTTSAETVVWAAERRFPLIMTAHVIEASKRSFELYSETAAEHGYIAGPQNWGFMFKCHAEETEKLADEVGRKFMRGVNNPFVLGNEARQRGGVQRVPGHVSLAARKRERELWGPGGYGGSGRHTYEDQIKDHVLMSGTPKTLYPHLRYIMDVLRPGSAIIWDGDGSMTHEDQMRSHRLMGQEVIPMLRELGKEFGLVSPFEVNDGTGYDQAAWAQAQARAKA